jgi:hypothetical protein
MTDVSMARIQWTYKCPFDDCPHTVIPPRLRCAVHAMFEDWHHFITEVPIFEVSRRLTWSRLRFKPWRSERN